MLKHSLAVFLFAFVVGCATTKPTAESVNSMKPCCQSLANLSFETLVAEQKKDLRFTATSPVFAFVDGNSHVSALFLGNSSAIRALDVEIPLSSGYLPSASVFVPSFVFLNSEKQLTRTVDEVTVRQRQDFWSGGYYFVRVDVQPDERYVVIYTNSKAIGSTLPFNNAGAGYVFSAGKTPIFVPGGQSTHQLARDSVGTISIKARL
jgi:maltose operon periplasmic protein